MTTLNAKFNGTCIINHAKHNGFYHHYSIRALEVLISNQVFHLMHIKPITALYRKNI